MATFPILNRMDVTRPPTHTSPQASRSSGTYLYTSANKTVEMTKLKVTSTTSNNVRNSPKEKASHVPKAASTVLTSNETMSKKPTPKTNPRERTLERRIRQSPRVLLRFGIPQIRSSEVCSSTNTVEAPMSKVTTPITVATRLFPIWVAL